MKKANCLIDKHYSIAGVEPELFGSFIEHLGRAVYTGVYEPGHPSADEQGFRRDVIALVKELNVPMVRYPGGNFVSGYNWTDGIGPRDSRPRRLDLAWHSIETNMFGIDEFVDWARKADTKVMAAVNLGTGSPQDAGYMVEYCNHPSGTYWSDLRRANGHDGPHKIGTWCLGNEMDGHWQICQLSAEDYAKKAREAAKIMKWVDPSIKLVACGSSSSSMPSYPEWDRKVLEYLYDHIDYLSLHSYYENDSGIEDFLASFTNMDKLIRTVGGIIDYAKAKNRSKRDVYLSFDEWNIWYQTKQSEHPWEIAPSILEDNYSLLDALAFGGLMCTLLNNCDRVKMASLAQLVNVIAPIITKPGGGVLKQSTFYPFAQVSRYGRGQALRPLLHSPLIETKKWGEVPLLQMAATFDENDRSVTLFVLNTDVNDAMSLSVDLRSFGKITLQEHLVMHGDDLDAANTFENPDAVVPYSMPVSTASNEHGTFSLTLPNLSWNVLRFGISK